ncbi:low temperature requirement protein A [Phenylobacterium sp. J367]|uniref:low temperature requirement protein A n=1 Tax=Phenylobacterium sp. J367 TaxID=2898435 RepID=UPI00215079D3|nr:low temperature requirement protein A [Phenylobacterium sp. J367]MCR5879935.1 low temperature requirement protein A [Phenylobacterium sp. J367]
MLAHPDGHVATSTVWVVVGGPAVSLAGALWFKWAVLGVVARSRVTGLVLLLALAAAAHWFSPLGLSAAVSAVPIFVGAWETAVRLRQPGLPVRAASSLP